MSKKLITAWAIAAVVIAGLTVGLVLALTSGGDGGPKKTEQASSAPAYTNQEKAFLIAVRPYLTDYMRNDPDLVLKEARTALDVVSNEGSESAVDYLYMKTAMPPGHAVGFIAEALRKFEGAK